MPFVPKKQAFNAHINEVVLGVGDKATAIGGQNVLPFHTFDAEIKNAPKIGVELTDFGMEEYTMPGEKEFLSLIHIFQQLPRQIERDAPAADEQRVADASGCELLLPEKLLRIAGRGHERDAVARGEAECAGRDIDLVLPALHRADQYLRLDQSRQLHQLLVHKLRIGRQLELQHLHAPARKRVGLDGRLSLIHISSKTPKSRATAPARG